MTHQDIEAFLAAVQSGSLSGAAQRLYITQPAVSRHIRSLEQALGCTLLVRKRGQRRVELTEQGRDFVAVAEKWRQVWQEARDVARLDRNRTLRVGSVGSVSTYLLPPVFRSFMEKRPASALTFHNYHSVEAYQYMADGTLDIALISDDMFHPQVETVPAYREPMVLAAGSACGLPDRVHPAMLNPARELRLPWNPEFDLWHSFWFSGGDQPRAVLDQMSLLESFFSWQGGWADSWAVTPMSVALAMRERVPIQILELEEGPPDERIYYLLGRRRKQELLDAFLDCLRQELGRIPHMQSYL